MDQEHIYQLLLKQLTDKLTSEEATLVAKALEESPSARELLDRLEATLLESNSIEEFLENISELEPALEPPVEPEIPSTPKIHYATLRRAAAAAVLLLSLGTLCFFLARHSGPPPAGGASLALAGGQTITLPDTGAKQITAGHTRITVSNRRVSLAGIRRIGNVEWYTLSVPAGHTYSLSLPDGSLIHVNGGSSIKFPALFSRHKREVFADGEAYFVISPTATRPFVVHAPQGDVTVLGTAFNLNCYAGRFTTSLAQGKVAITVKDRQVLLEAGQEALLDSLSGLTVRSFHIDNANSWMTGKYTFDNATLEEVARYVTRYYHIPVYFDQPTIASRRFSGILNRNQPVDTLLQNLLPTGIFSYMKADTLHFRLQEE